MIIERSLHPEYLSNTYLVGTQGGEAFFIDAGGPMTPLLAAVERHELRPTHVLLTHHHHDHVEELGRLREQWPPLRVLAHADEAARVSGDVEAIEPGAPLSVAGLDDEGDERCTAMGRPATLVLLGDDYDGGHKAWVRWPDGRDDIVPGSQVQRG